MHNIRVVLNQAGAALELHNVNDSPVTLLLIRPDHLERFRDELGVTMRHATIGQLSMMLARRLVNSMTDLDPNLWEYNASTDRYSSL